MGETSFAPAETTVPAVWPPPRRSQVLPVTLGAMLGVGVIAGAYMLHHTPWPPDPGGGGRCARAFDASLRAARGGTDAGLVTLGDAALAGRCGRQALEAFEAVGADGDEAVAWQLWRFHDPGEVDPVFRGAGAADPRRAAIIGFAWRARSPRLAAALTALCAGLSASLSARDPDLAHACRP